MGFQTDVIQILDSEFKSGSWSFNYETSAQRPHNVGTHLMGTTHLFSRIFKVSYLEGKIRQIRRVLSLTRYAAAKPDT